MIEQKKYDKVEILNHALRVSEKHFGLEDVELLQLLLSLGNSYFDLGEYQQAK